MPRSAELRSAWTAEGGCPHVDCAGGSPHAAANQVAAEAPGQSRNTAPADHDLGISAHAFPEISPVLELDLPQIELWHSNAFQLVFFEQAGFNRGCRRSQRGQGSRPGLELGFGMEPHRGTYTNVCLLYT